jgi:hypothetical protein
LGGRGPIGISRRQLAALLAVFVLGAAFIVYSVRTHPTIQSHVNVLNTRQPMNVLVGVQGTPLYPGFVGFVAEVKPKSRVLNVVPISGKIMVRVQGAPEPLYRAVSDASPGLAMKLVSRASRVRINRYFYLDFGSLDILVSALYYDTPHWPKNQTPLTMLKILGYPGGRIQPKQEMALVREMIDRLPLVNPIKVPALFTIPNRSRTNLSRHQLFLLANYVRGDQLRRISLPAHHSKRGSHG